MIYKHQRKGSVTNNQFLIGKKEILWYSWSTNLKNCQIKEGLRLFCLAIMNRGYKEVYFF